MNWPGRTLRCRFVRSDSVFDGVLALTAAKLAAAEAAAATLLTPGERAAATRFAIPRRRHPYLLGRLAAKTAGTTLSSTAPGTIEVQSGIFGFPYLSPCADSPGAPATALPAVSIAHAGGIAVALAASPAHPVAVDIEPLDAHRISLVEAELGPRAHHDFNQSGALPTALLTWTAIEALSKLLRTGLTMPLELFCLKNTQRRADGVFLCEFTNFLQYRAELYASERHILAIAMPRLSELRFTIPSAGVADVLQAVGGDLVDW